MTTEKYTKISAGVKTKTKSLSSNKNKLADRLVSPRLAGGFFIFAKKHYLLRHRKFFVPRVQS